MPRTLFRRPFKVAPQKEPNYNVIILSICGTLGPCNNNKNIVLCIRYWRKVEFSCTVVVRNHYPFCDYINNFNAKCHNCGTNQGISLENAQKRMWWSYHVFAYVIASSNLNRHNT